MVFVPLLYLLRNLFPLLELIRTVYNCIYHLFLRFFVFFLNRNCMVQCDLLNLHNLNFNSDFLKSKSSEYRISFLKRRISDLLAAFETPNYQIYCYQIKPIDLVFIWCHRVCTNFDSVPITIHIQKGSSSESLFRAIFKMFFYRYLFLSRKKR